VGRRFVPRILCRGPHAAPPLSVCLWCAEPTHARSQNEAARTA
jgi:hypothetical protein